MSTLTVNIEVAYKGLVFMVSGEYIPYIPGRYNGPPEDCAPSEGGYIEDPVIKIFDGKHWAEVDEILSEKAASEITAIADNDCWKQAGR